MDKAAYLHAIVRKRAGKVVASVRLQGPADQRRAVAADTDADSNGTNESTAQTDDPSLGGAADPTSFVVSGATVTGSKTVSGNFSTGGAVVYTIVLSNSGNAAAADNAGNELTDVLPAGLTLVGASASSGTAVATVATRTVTWNGAIAAAGSSVTITINATVDASAAGQTLVNQATFAYDADFNGSNESAGTTDDPSLHGTSDPTTLTVVAAPVEEVVPVPALSAWMVALMVQALSLGAGRRLRVRRERK